MGSSERDRVEDGPPPGDPREQELRQLTPVCPDCGASGFRIEIGDHEMGGIRGKKYRAYCGSCNHLLKDLWFWGPPDRWERGGGA